MSLPPTPPTCGQLKNVNMNAYASYCQYIDFNNPMSRPVNAPDDYNWTTSGHFQNNTNFKHYTTNRGTTIALPSTTAYGFTLPTFENKNCGEIKQYMEHGVDGAGPAYASYCQYQDYANNPTPINAPDTYNWSTSGSFQNTYKHV